MAERPTRSRSTRSRGRNGSGRSEPNEPVEHARESASHEAVASGTDAGGAARSREHARSLGLVLDTTDARPLYRQLFDEIVRRIGSGAFPAGFRLPPTRNLATELGAHRNTVVRAYRELEEAGFLDSTVGRGTFVRPVRARSESAPTPKLPTAVGPAIPWSALVAERAQSEPLARIVRRARRPLLGSAIDLARMQPSPDLLPAKLFERSLAHVLDRMGGRALGYAPHEGATALREQIALDLARQGVPARADDVLVTTGSQQALDILVRALVDPGDTVLVQTPTYGGALQVLAAAGARIEGLANDADGPVLPTQPRERVKLLYLMPNHANPTGQCITEPRRREIVAWARQRGVPIVEDDYAGDLDLDGTPAPPALRALDGDVLYTASYSKRLIPAMRVGFVLAPEGIRPHLAALQHTASLGSSLLLQLTLAEMLERGFVHAHTTRMRDIYRHRRDALVDTLETHLDRRIRVLRPARGVATWIALPTSVDLDSLSEQARRDGVLVATGDLFAGARVATSADAHGVRLTYCFETEERLVEGAKRFARALDALLRTGSRGRARDEGPALV